MGWKALFKGGEQKPEEKPEAKSEKPRPLDPIIAVTETNVVKKEAGHGSKPKPVTRTAMGEYIVPPGGKHLTVLANPNVPGPATYLPRMTLTKPSAPQYSLKGRYKQTDEGKRPSPADYGVSQDLLWKRRTLKLKGREQDIDFTIPGPSDIGPAAYNIEYDTLGKGGHKPSIKGRKPFKFYGGPTSLQMQAEDTASFVTPGPDYRPGSADWMDGPRIKSFGAPLPHNNVLNRFPVGPADYNLADVPAWDSPAYSLAKRFSNPNTIVYASGPGPNEYDLGTTVGQCPGVSMTSRREINKPAKIPAPNSYTLKDTVDLKAKAASLTYRWSESDGTDGGPSSVPGPGQYDTPSDTIGKGPAFTFRPRLLPRFRTTCGDGPAKYDIRKNFMDNDKPAFTMGKRLKGETKETVVPGPGQYDVNGKPGMKSAPAFSLAKRLPKPLRTAGPGPAMYKPNVRDSAPMYSITRRPGLNLGKPKSTPGPYILPEGTTRWGRQVGGGVTLKSRASPYIYSGFKTHKFLEPMPSL